MKQTGFSRGIVATAQREPRDHTLSMQALVDSTLPRPASTMQGTTSGETVVKRKPIRSKALLAAVRTLPCMVTGRTDGVEAAHSNWGHHGKSKSVKADDNRVAALHHSLHREIDQGSFLTAEQRQELWWNAHVATIKELLARGLWPAKVPVPQLEDFWK